MKQLFTDHLEETKGQVLRLRTVFEHLGEKPTGQHCNGMEGVIEEGADALEKDEEGPSFDTGLVGAALRTEHYEIAGYQAAIAMAETLGLDEVAELLEANLAEEEAAAEKITAAAKPILEASAEQPEEKKGPKSAKEKYSAKKSVEDEKRRLRRICGGRALRWFAGHAERALAAALGDVDGVDGRDAG